MNRPLAALSALFALRPDERDAAGILFACSFAKGISTVSIETAATALFFVQYDVRVLPWVYIATAITSVLLGLTYVRVGRRVSPVRLFYGVVLFLSIANAIFYVAILLGAQVGASAPLMIWRDVHWALLEMQFWALAALIFNIRQSKRLLGPLASGGILGYVIGGLLTPTFVAFLNPQHLLAVSLLAMLLYLALNRHLVLAYPERFAMESPGNTEDAPARDGTAGVSRRPYVTLIFLITTGSLLAFYMLDYIFYQQVNLQIHGEAALASFFGVFAGVYGLASFTTGAFLSGRFLVRFGVGAAMLAIPVTGIVGVSAAAIFVGTGTLPVLAFGIFVATKLLNEVLGEALQGPTFRLLCQPFQAAERLRLIAIRESVVQPAAAGLSGVLILVAVELLGWGVWELVIGYLVLAVIQSIAVLGLREGYVGELARSARQRALGREQLDLADPASRAVLERGLNSRNAANVVSCLALMEQELPEHAVALLLERLDDDRAEVRAHVLQRLEALAPADAVEPLRRRLDAEPDPAVLALVLPAYVAVAEADGLSVAREMLNAERSEIRQAAMLALVRHAGLDGWLAVSRRVEALARSASPGDRALAARVLGACPLSGMHGELSRLLHDQEPKVRLAAAAAIGEARDPALLAPLSEALSDATVRSQARQSLESFGERALGVVIAAFERAAEEHERVDLLRIAARLAGRSALPFIIECAATRPRSVRYAALRILAAAHESLPGLSSGLLEFEIAEAKRDIEALKPLAQDPECAILVRALEDEVAAALDRILLILMLTEPDARLAAARSLLLAGSDDMRARGIELLENVLRPHDRSQVLPLFESTLHRRKVHTEDVRPHANTADCARWIVTADIHTPWTVACALAVAVRRPWLTVGQDIDARLAAPERLVRETAAWAAIMVSADTAEQVAAKLSSNPDAVISRVATARRNGWLTTAL